MAADEGAPSAARSATRSRGRSSGCTRSRTAPAPRAIDVQISDDTVMIVIDVELTPAERTLIDASQHEAVKATREAFQQAIAATFGAIVERATGRRVESF